MKTLMKFNLSPDSIATLNTYPVCVQDSIHIGTKLRNRLLNTSIALYIGNRVATVTHLQALIDTVSKEEHGLYYSDISPEDRQNYCSLEKTMKPRVLEALKNHVVDSEATIKYVTLCKMITSSFEKGDLKPIDRIYNIWYSLYFLRCWRKWIQMSNEFSLTHNFISFNAFACIEVNAHALVDLIVKLRSSQRENMFIPPLFASQPCESIFRRMRSMGTANFTKINFSLNELLHMISRVEMMNEIVCTSKDISFPRVKSNSENCTTAMVLPSDQEIMRTMKSAQKAALEDARWFDIDVNASDITTSEISSETLDTIQKESDNMEVDDVGPEEPREEPGEEGHTEDRQKCVDVVSSDGTIKNIRKSTFVWMLSESKGKLSSDRLKRVQNSSTNETKQSKKIKLSGQSNEEQVFVKSAYLNIGEWALFKTNCNERDDDSRENFQANATLISSHLIGNVLGFRYIDEKNRIKRDKSNHASTDASQQQNIEILIFGYSFDEGRMLIPNKSKMQYAINIKKYMATMKNPIVKRNDGPDKISYMLPCEFCDVKDFILNL